MSNIDVLDISRRVVCKKGALFLQQRQRGVANCRMGWPTALRPGQVCQVLSWLSAGLRRMCFSLQRMRRYMCACARAYLFAHVCSCTYTKLSSRVENALEAFWRRLRRLLGTFFRCGKGCDKQFRSLTVLKQYRQHAGEVLEVSEGVLAMF